MCNSYTPKGRKSASKIFVAVAVCLSSILLTASTSAVAETTVKGVLIANGKTIELPYVYVWKEKEGFYDASDPAWSFIFVERPLKPQEIGVHVSDTAWVHVGITETQKSTQQRKITAYTQSLKFSAGAGGNISGGAYPEVEIKGLHTDHVSGRIWHANPQKVFEDSFQFDLAFSAPISDPNAPTVVGTPLPAGGGEPGQAYLKWTEIVHTGDIELLKSIMPSEMADQFGSITAEEAQQEVKFMQEMTPTDNIILSGSSDGEVAILQTEGMMEGEKISVEVTMTKMSGFWIPTNMSM